MIRYDASPDSPETNDLVASARTNSSYKVLRGVLKWILLSLWGSIFVSGLSTIVLGTRFIELGGSGVGFPLQNTSYALKDIGQSLTKEVIRFELPNSFSASEMRVAYNTKRAELAAKEERYISEANAARRERNESAMNEAASVVNTTRVQITDLTNAKNRLESRINEIDEERKSSVGSLQSGLRVIYIVIVALVMVIAALLVYALYQAAIVVIDIADCQVEIFMRNKSSAGKTT